MRCPNCKFYRLVQICLLILTVGLISACSKSPSPAEVAGTADEPAVATSAPLTDEEPNLALRLKVGDKFPLQKTVVTTLVQPGPSGMERSTSHKEFLLTITIEAMPQEGPRAGHRQMGVTFHAVRFSRELNGQKLEYESRKSQGPVPAAAQPYQGMVGNSFSFWLNPHNQIEGIIDFDKFVKRCLKGIPAERVEEVWNNLAIQSGTDGIASFVDDSIGLLPKSKVAIGDSWTVTRQAQQPIALVCKNRYTLQQIDGQQAEISILGEILPSAVLVDTIPGARQNNLSMSIKGGKSTGSCTIDLRTGLPIHSQVEQFVDMFVKLKNGEEFTQHKQMITTIRAFPSMDRPASPDGPVVRQGDRRGKFGQQTAKRVNGQWADTDTSIAQPPLQLPRR